MLGWVLWCLHGQPGPALLSACCQLWETWLSRKTCWKRKLSSITALVRRLHGAGDVLGSGIGSRLDQTGGTEWHQEKVWEPAESWWCSMHHRDDAHGPTDPVAPPCPGTGHSVPAQCEQCNWDVAVGSASLSQVLGRTGNSIHAAVVPAVKLPGMEWDWKCRSCRRAQPSPGACHTPVVPRLAAPFPERVVTTGTVSGCHLASLHLCLLPQPLPALHFWPEQTQGWFGNCEGENYNRKANFRPGCATLCMHALGGSWCIKTHNNQKNQIQP